MPVAVLGIISNYTYFPLKIKLFKSIPAFISKASDAKSIYIFISPG